MKRAANVNQDFPINISVPAGTTCSGSVAGQQNVCFMKIANANRAGPFGGVIAFQMAGAGAGAGNNTAAAGATTAGANTGGSTAGGATAEGVSARGATTGGATTAGTTTAGSAKKAGANVAKRFIA